MTGKLPICKWFKRLFPEWMTCEHEPEEVECVAVVNGVASGRRRFRVCQKCGATSAMVRFK